MARLTKEQGRVLLQQKVDDYRVHAGVRELPGSSYTEAAARLDFIDHLLRALGWDLDNGDRLVESEREVGIERTGADGVAGLNGRPDYTLRVAGKRMLYWEAKKPSVNLWEDPKPAFQVRTYGWTSDLPVSVVTNFRQLAVYDTRIAPHADDEAHVARRPNATFVLDELVPRFDELYDLLSRDAIAGPGYEALFASAALRSDDPFDERFLAKIKDWRYELAKRAFARTPDATGGELGRRVQRILNRILFLRIAEERGLEDYEALLHVTSDAEVAAMLAAADRRYNAGLFRTVDEDRWSLADIEPIIKELYFPRSPFAFGVLDSETLAAVYEQFLGDQIDVDGGTVHVTTKPEVVHAGGIVPTPQPIVDALLDRAIGPEEQRLRESGQIADFTVCDPACGSGVFLISAFRRLVSALEVAKQAPPSLPEKRELLRRTIFGVDIDSEAVEVAKLGLMLELLDGESRSSLAAEPTPLLETLDANVTHGNSLIDFHFDALFPCELDDPETLDKVAPYGWAGRLDADGGFNAVVGNPPYVRIQALAAYAPEQLKYFQSPEAPYRSSRAFNFDVYMLFIERAIDLLRPDGVVAFVVPSRLASSMAATELRGLLGQRELLREVVSFGVQQVFPGRSTYVCLLTLSAATPDPHVTIEHVDDLEAWLTGVPGRRHQRDATEFGAPPWAFATSEHAAPILDALKTRFTTTLTEVADIFVGVQTSADKVFYIKNGTVADGVVSFIDKNGDEQTVEQAITRPALVDRKLAPFLTDPEPDALAIFPYEIEVGQRAQVMTAERLQDEFPLAWAYLNHFKDELAPPARSVSPVTPDTWYRYGRSQSLTKLDGDKIIVRVLAKDPQYCFDSKNLLTPGGGDGGPYYLIRPKADSGVDPHYLIALLSYPAIEQIVTSGGRAFRGGYYVHRKAFLKDVPVPMPATMSEIAHRSRELGALVRESIKTTDPRTRLTGERLVASRRRELEELVRDALGLNDADLAVLGE